MHRSSQGILVTGEVRARAQAWQDRLGPSFDLPALERLVALDPEERSGLLTRLLELFAQSLGKQAQALEEAADRGDVNSIRMAAHAARSACMSMGAGGFALDCQRLERRAQAWLEVAERRAASQDAEEAVDQGHVHDLLHGARHLGAQARDLLAQMHQAQHRPGG